LGYNLNAEEAEKSNEEANVITLKKLKDIQYSQIGRRHRKVHHVDLKNSHDRLSLNPLLFD
jgi:hypothetical protein